MTLLSGNKKINDIRIVATAQGDVTGDRIPDFVYLVGQVEPGSQFVQNIGLVIRNGKNNKITRIKLEENAGYNPTLFLGDFTGNGVDDILITIDSGGSGAITYDYVYSFLAGKAKLLFSSDSYNNIYNYEITYLDNYKVKAVSEINNTTYIIDLQYKGREYLDAIYYEDGRLKKPITGFVNPLSSLFPVDVERNGVYQLLAFQKIAGMYNADALGYFQNFLKYQKDNFNLFNQYVAIFGYEGVETSSHD